MSFGTGTRALIDQQTDILAHLRMARDAMTEATPNLRDYPNHAAWQAALGQHKTRITALDGLIEQVSATRAAIRRGAPQPPIPSAHADCPACSGPLNTGEPIPTATGAVVGLIQRCRACGALAATLTTEANGPVPGLPYQWHSGPSQDQRYYDIVTVNASGERITRRHGWYDVASGKITQTG